MALKKINAGIVGAAGYTGAELLRWLLRHPNVHVTRVTSREYAGQALSVVFPSLLSELGLEFCQPDVNELKKCDVVFFATPHGVAMKQAPELLDAGVKVIDLSADFRIKNADLWAKWYGMPHESLNALEQAVYGLPELYRKEIKQANLIANPGCYPTASSLALAPLVENDLIELDSIIIDAKSGVSGAGRGAKVDSLYCEVAEDFKPYAVSGHRHQPEIAQTLSGLAGTELDLTFVPHLIPMIRGIEVTAYGNLKKQGVDLQALFETRYANEVFVHVLPTGQWPKTSSVRASNHVQLAVHQPKNSQRVIVMAVEDNVVKGASGQAIQNMNLMFGLDEQTGLDSLPVWP